MSSRVSPAKRLRVGIDELFAGSGHLEDYADRAVRLVALPSIHAATSNTLNALVDSGRLARPRRSSRRR